MPEIPVRRPKLVSYGVLTLPYKHINYGHEAAEIMREYLKAHGLAGCENMVGIALNSARKVLDVFTIAVGSMDQVISEPAIINAQLWLRFAKGFVIGHNHPNGNHKPSPEDIALFRELKKGYKHTGLVMYDGVIIADDSEKFYSFAGDKNYQEEERSVLSLAEGE